MEARTLTKSLLVADPVVEGRVFGSSIVALVTGATSMATLINSLWIMAIVLFLGVTGFASIKFVLRFLRAFKQLEMVLLTLTSQMQTLPPGLSPGIEAPVYANVPNQIGPTSPSSSTPFVVAGPPIGRLPPILPPKLSAMASLAGPLLDHVDQHKSSKFAFDQPQPVLIDSPQHHIHHPPYPRFEPHQHFRPERPIFEAHSIGSVDPVDCAPECFNSQSLPPAPPVIIHDEPNDESFHIDPPEHGEYHKRDIRDRSSSSVPVSAPVSPAAITNIYLQLSAPKDESSNSIETTTKVPVPKNYSSDLPPLQADANQKHQLQYLISLIERLAISLQHRYSSSSSGEHPMDSNYPY